jgi:tetratricopeptide (TPR) repeat protein
MRAPLRGVELKAGTHVVKLTHADFWPITRRLSVEAGRALRLDVDLSWEAVSRALGREPPFATALRGSPDDPYFERGLRQLASGDYAEALLTLEPVARRLRQAGKEKELARCEFYVGVALLELNRQGSAKERFERALESDHSLRLPAESFSPKVTTFFSRVREAASRKP